MAGEEQKPWTTPKGYVPPTMGELWRYVRYALPHADC